MSNHVENTDICQQCDQAITIVGLDSSQCLNCNWIQQPDQPATKVTQATRRKSPKKSDEGQQLDLFGGVQR